MSLQDFELVLKNILSDNNAIRKQAEDYFNQTRTQPDYCVSSLLQIMKTSTHVEIRGLACVLLRKCISKTEDSLYPKLSPQAKALVKNELFAILAEEKVEHIRNKLVHSVSAFVASLLEGGESQELLLKLFEWTKSSTPSLKESALGIFSQLATHLMSKGLEPYIDQLKIVLLGCLNDVNPASNKVRIAALSATCSIVLVSDKAMRTKLQDLIPHLLNVLARALNANDIPAATTVIESFIEIAVAFPSFFKSCVANVISAMFQIAKTSGLDESIRHLAMEYMISMAESSASLIRNIPNFIDNLFPLCMEMMVDIEEDESWVESYEDDDLELTNYDVGLESLDRLALSIGGKLVQPVAFRCIPQYLNNQNWKYRLAGLMAIAQTAEGCQEQYQAHLTQLVGMALKHFADPHPRVRYAAIHCGAQLSTDFSGIIQTNFHQQIVPALLHAMDDPIPRVQSHAATAVVNFVEDCEHKWIEPYLDALLTKLLHLLRGGKRFVQEQSLSAISAIADCAESLFVKYYDHIMPFLKEILLRATGKQDRKLRARAIECVSLIGVGVGKAKFDPDARQIMDLLMRTQQQTLEPDDPQIHHLLQAWARIAKCLGDDFIPYLNFVMPPLLKAADQPPEVKIADADDDSKHDDEGMESVTLSIKGVGDKRISIRTSILEEKALACNMLYSYAHDLKDGFVQWVDKVANVMVPLLKFPYLEEIRETAATITPQLLKSVKLAAEKNKADVMMVKKLLDFIIGSLIEALKIEPEAKTATVLIESLNQCVQTIGNDCLATEQLDAISQTIKAAVLQSLNRKQSLEEEAEEEEDEDEKDRIDDEELLEDDLQTNFIDLIGTLLKTHQNFVQYFINNLWVIYTKMLDPKLPDDEHRVGLCVLCDFVEHGRGAAVHVAKDIISAFLMYSTDQNAEVRQAAVYGLGACAQFTGPSFNPFALESVLKLKSAIALPNAKDETNAAATCNAVSALFKVAQFKQDVQGINIPELLTHWMKCLPVGGDSIEARIVHKNFVDLVAQNNPILVNNANIPFILKVFSNIAGTEFAHEETTIKIGQLLRQMQVQLPAQLLQQSWALLSQQERTALQNAVTNPQTGSPVSPQQKQP